MLIELGQAQVPMGVTPVRAVNHDEGSSIACFFVGNFRAIGRDNSFHEYFPCSEMFLI
jgi:hypothetical protein